MPIGRPSCERATGTFKPGRPAALTQVEKIPTQYKERREYRSGPEESHYQIVLRYNRVV